jgi:hypothetical protein
MKKMLLIALTSFICIVPGCGQKDQPNETVAPAEDDPVLRLAQENPTPLRGYRAINMLVRERIVANPDFEMLSYVQEPDPLRDFRGGSILPLLGGFQGRGTTMSNQSAVPGPMNMLLWFTVIEGLAADLAGHCTASDSAVPVKPAIAEALEIACTPGVDNRDGFARIWDLVLKHDGNPLQKDEWLYWLDNADPELALTGRAARSLLVHDAILTALFSPEFLAGR